MTYLALQSFCSVCLWAISPCLWCLRDSVQETWESHLCTSCFLLGKKREEKSTRSPPGMRILILNGLELSHILLKVKTSEQFYKLGLWKRRWAFLDKFWEVHQFLFWRLFKQNPCAFTLLRAVMFLDSHRGWSCTSAGCCVSSLLLAHINEKRTEVDLVCGTLFINEGLWVIIALSRRVMGGMRR